MFEFINEVVAGVILLGIASAGGYLFNFIRMKKLEITTALTENEALKDDIHNIKRVLVMVAKRLDKGSKKYHADPDSAYEELVKDLLTDEILGTNKTAI